MVKTQRNDYTIKNSNTSQNILKNGKIKLQIMANILRIWSVISKVLRIRIFRSNHVVIVLTLSHLALTHRYNILKMSNVSTLSCQKILTWETGNAFIYSRMKTSSSRSGPVPQLISSAWKRQKGASYKNI